MSLPYRMLLTVIFAYFDAPIYRLKYKNPGAITTSSVKLMQLDKVDASTAEPQPSQPRPVAPSASQPVPPSVGQSSSQNTSSSTSSPDNYVNLNSLPPQSTFVPPSFD